MENPEIATEFMYWFFAHTLGFTPEQVDKLPYDRMVYMFELEKKAQREKLKNG